jgi:hypothetical protein
VIGVTETRIGGRLNPWPAEDDPPLRAWGTVARVLRQGVQEPRGIRSASAGAAPAFDRGWNSPIKRAVEGSGDSLHNWVRYE